VRYDVVAALDPSIAEQSGAYLDDGGVAENGSPVLVPGLSNYCAK
jgi:hypothetical protein